MLILEKLNEITEGNHEFVNRDAKVLLDKEMRNYRDFEANGETIHQIQSHELHERFGYKTLELRLSKEKVWSVKLIFRRFKEDYY